MNYLAKAAEIVDKIKKYKEDLDLWKQIKQTKDVTVWWKPSPDWNGTLYKSECYIEASPEVVFSYIDPSPASPRAKWDKAVKEISVLKQINKDVSIIRTLTHSAFGGLISSREFLDLVINTRNEECIATQSEGIDFSECPARSDPVRGVNHPCAIICHRVPDSPERTRMTSYIQTDLGGMLPKSVVDSALPSNMVDFCTNLKKTLQDDGHWKAAVINGN